MALTQTQTQLRDNVRKLCDIEGTSALARHPHADVNEYVNRGIAALHRKLTEAIPDQRLLSTQTITTVAGTSTYALGSTFETLISIDLTANGVKRWLTPYEMEDRPHLSDPDNVRTDYPYSYRLRGSNIELLPTPGGIYTVNLWFVPAPSQLASNSDTYDTIARLDDYIILYAATIVTKKDRVWDLHDRCQRDLKELLDDVYRYARTRDMNLSPRVHDVSRRDRFGRAWRR